MNALTSIDATTVSAWLETLMLLCFGLAWPVANMRMLRTRRPEGKGLAFTTIILSGYLAGAAAKLVAWEHGAALPPVFVLYVLNTLSVGVNLWLQWHLGRRAPATQPASRLHAT